MQWQLEDGLGVEHSPVLPKDQEDNALPDLACQLGQRLALAQQQLATQRATSSQVQPGGTCPAGICCTAAMCSHMCMQVMCSADTAAPTIAAAELHWACNLRESHACRQGSR